MKRFYALAAVGLFLSPCVVQAQVVDSTLRVIERISPDPRQDSALGQSPDWGGQPPLPDGITSRLVYVDDGFGDHRGCVAPANAAELVGNIALISRGLCEFGHKALRAQEAGAIAFIVHNCPFGTTDCASTGDDELINMGAGVSGDSVTIPGAFISYNQALAANYPALVENTANVVMVNLEPAIVVAIEPTPIARSTVYPARPNPFSVSTEFGVQLLRTQDVRVEVFNALGQRVALLHDGALAAGSDVHEFSLEASALPSGVYLYRVTGEDFVETNSVVLAR